MSPEPRANPYFAGHVAAIGSLYHEAGAARLHHGWLISGAPGIGKATLAFRFARWLLAGASSENLFVPETQPVFRRVAANSHPDLFTIERRVNEKTDKLQSEIVIGTIRKAVRFIHHTPAEGGWRVLIVDGAEDMNPNAANALLKILEEPPARAILLLTSAAPGRLLPTIRSRCRALPLGKLEDDEVAGLLGRYAPELSPAECVGLAELAEGSIGTALTLAAEGGLALAGLVDEALAAPVSPARAQNIAETVTRAGDAGDKFESFFGLLGARLAARTRAAARAGQGVRQLGADVKIWEDLRRLEREVIGLNLDKRAAIIVALSQLHGS